MSTLERHFDRIDWLEADFLRSNGFWPATYIDYYDDETDGWNKRAFVLDFSCAQQNFFRFYDSFPRSHFINDL
jgi:hypothetical protein